MSAARILALAQTSGWFWRSQDLERDLLTYLRQLRGLAAAALYVWIPIVPSALHIDRVANDDHALAARKGEFIPTLLSPCPELD